MAYELMVTLYTTMWCRHDQMGEAFKALDQITAEYDATPLVDGGGDGDTDRYGRVCAHGRIFNNKPDAQYDQHEIGKWTIRHTTHATTKQ